MATTGDIHVNDIGTSFEITFYDKGILLGDISTATDKRIIFLKDDGTTVLDKTASFLTDGTDSIIQWVTTLPTDLDQEGTWSIQGELTMPEGKWSSDIQTFPVLPNIKATILV